MADALSGIGTYLPAWVGADGRRTPGADEDVATLAVAAGRAALHAAPDVEVTRVVVCTRSPDDLLGDIATVVLAGLGLSQSVPVEERLGGGPAILDAIASGPAGTLVIGVDPTAPAAAGAVLLGAEEERRLDAAVVQSPLPVATVPARAGGGRVYDDPRLLRERGWLRCRDELALAAGVPVVVCGMSPKDAARLGPDADLQAKVTAAGAAGAVEAVAAAAESRRDAFVVAFENGRAASLRVRRSDVRVERDERAPIEAGRPAPSGDSGLILSLPAYERAFAGKVGFVAQRCACGALHLPARTMCPVCGALDGFSDEALPRQGSVYSVATVHMPVPGKAVPYSLVLVDLDGVPLRVLAATTDTRAGSVGIDDDGTLVLRLVAVREGVRDYGYAFRPVEVPA